MGPAEVEGCLRVASVEESVDETGGEAVPAADAVDDIEFDGFGLVGFAFHPEHGAPGVAVGGVDFAEGGSDGFDVGKFAGDFFHHAEEGGGIQFGVGFDVLAFESESFLEVFFVADEDVNVFDDAIERFLGFVESTADLPELSAVVEVEGGDGASGFGGLHGFDDEFRGGGGKSSEDSAAMEPADAAGEDFLPVEVAGLEKACGFVAAVVEHDGSANAVSLVAVDGGHVGSANAVVAEAFVEGFDAHRADAFVDEFADGVVDHGGGDAGFELEAVGEIGGAVEFTAADVDGALAGFAEGDDARVEAVDEGTEGEEVEGTGGCDVEHERSSWCGAERKLGMSIGGEGRATGLSSAECKLW